MKKTSINLAEFPEFQRKMVTQISDDPTTGFARVIVSERNNIMDDIQMIELVAHTYYVEVSTHKIIPQMTHRTLSKGEPWFIDNSYEVVLVDAKGKPLPNPDYNAELEESDENYPYLKMRAYDRFSAFLFSEKNPVSLPFIWKLNVALDDQKGYFDM